ncbi:MAG: extensin family protein [Rhodobacter sp.]|uniref:extensin-like domain-containing protein n=1 Tax=Pararhodobacter sp. TaxID=2127056 RepID=UPI001DD6B34F|nr:extensin family protein [Pararhodobacter sp.]MCB1346949.1 extensin family protein [Paracoccaceae bacterium]MCC0072048.1 extensin family protein [Rhodobacter sp.]HPD92674.1 extensin family protein [Pararhodobacter sp.]
MRAVLLILSLILGAGTALAEVPWHSLFPRPRPAQLGGPAVGVPVTDNAVVQALAGTLAAPGIAPGIAPGSVAEETALAVARSLVPRRRPSGLRAPTRPVQPVRAVAAATGATGATGPVRAGLCNTRGLTGRELPPITSRTRGCGVDAPVSVTAVQGIPLSRPATLGCDAAVAFDRWVREQMLPAVGSRGGGVTQIRVIGDYSCRTRNSQPGARISEHGRGRAIDFAGYRLANGDVVTVQGDWGRGRNGRALAQMYRGACGIFGTTLSPAADRYHQDHFHFDVASYRSGPYCR